MTRGDTMAYRAIEPKKTTNTRLTAVVAVISLVAGLACVTEPEEEENNSTSTNNQMTSNMEPGNMEPGNMEPGNQEPGNMEPGNQEPGNMEPGNMEPGNMEPGNMEPGNQEPGNMEPGNNTATTSGWAVFPAAFPCVDKPAMWFDDDNNGFWGCGKTGNGGLFTTTDGGLNWTKQARVSEKINGFFRDNDGRLLVAGQFGGPAAVIDESNPAILKAERLYKRGNNAFTSVEQGESIAVTSDGQILVDSLNGTTAAYFPGNNETGLAWMQEVCTGDDASNFNPDESGTWCELHGVAEEKLEDPDATVTQISNIIVHNDRFFAAGRYIADGGKVQLPSKLDGATYHMKQLYVQEEGAGEMMDITVTGDESIVAVGTDQSDNFPLIFRCAGDADCYEAENWTRAELDLFFIDPYWTEAASGSRDGRAVAASKNIVVAVGNFVPNAKGGWALISRDNGETWEDLTPTLNDLNPDKARVPMLHNVHIFESGKILLVGETSFVYTP